LQLTISQSVNQSVLASSPSVTLNQISVEVRQLQGWSHGASSLAGGRIRLLSTLYWSLHHLTLWSLLCSTLYWSLHHLTLWSLLCSTLYWSLHHLTLWSLLCATLYWSLLVWVSLSHLQLTVNQSAGLSVSCPLALKTFNHIRDFYICLAIS